MKSGYVLRPVLSGLGIVLYLAVLFLLVRNSFELVALPAWVQANSDRSVMEQWLEASMDENFEPTFINNERIVVQLVQDYPTAYLSGANGFSAGIWVIQINGEFVVYEFKPDGVVLQETKIWALKIFQYVSGSKSTYEPTPGFHRRFAALAIAFFCWPAIVSVYFIYLYKRTKRNRSLAINAGSEEN